MKNQTLLVIILVLVSQIALGQKNMKKATFGMGCFWCTEAVFKSLKGVNTVTSGYEGGHLPNPTYEEIITGETGHAEVVQIKFDPKIISFNELLEVFWKVHDPTTLNRQGADIGTQYRSVIFYHDESQKSIAEQYKKILTASNIYGKKKIVTEITKTQKFYSAEAYHQNYYENNLNNPYCRNIILPKIQELEKIFKNKIKKF